MTRRNVFSSVAAATVAGGALTAAPARRSIIEMRTFRLRNGADDQGRRIRQFLQKSMAPALVKAGAGTAAVFDSVIGQSAPFVLVVSSYPDLAGYQAAAEGALWTESRDTDLNKARSEWLAAPGLGYVREEVTLLRGFKTLPAIEAPSMAKPRICEVRQYESSDVQTLQTKIRMFDEAEIAIFRRTGIQPVFFGEAIAGSNMPNLTYMVTYDDLAAREKAWSTFLNDEGWKELRGKAEFADAKIVSNITNYIVRPTLFLTK